MSDLFDYDGFIDQVARTSPAAQKCLDTEAYLLTLDVDDVTSEAIAETLLLRLMDDLHEIGITFTSDVATVLPGWQDRLEFVKLAGMILPAQLPSVLEQNAPFRRGVKSILEGGDGLDDSTIKKYLKYIGEWNPDFSIFHKDIAAQMCDHLTSSQTFDRYLTNVMDAVSVVDPVMAEREKEFLAVLDGVNSKMLDGINILLMKGYFTPEDVNAAERTLKLSFKALVDRVDAMARFAFVRGIQLQSSPELTDQAMTLYRRCIQELEVSCRLFSDWWTVRPDKSPSWKDAIIMVMWRCFWFDRTKDQMGDALDEIWAQIGSQIEERDAARIYLNNAVRALAS